MPVISSRERLRARPVPVKTFWKNVLLGNGCWIWQGQKSTSGYGRYVDPYTGTPHRAHRYAYALVNDHLAHGSMLIPTCHNRLCVRPDHMQVADSALDQAAKAESRPLTQREVQTLLTEVWSGKPIESIASALSISKEAACRWRDQLSQAIAQVAPPSASSAAPKPPKRLAASG
jgi:hypothetical protein